MREKRMKENITIYKETLLNKLLKVQQKQADVVTAGIDNVIQEKIKRYKKAGKPVTVESLMQGSGLLKKMGITEEYLKSRIENAISEDKDGGDTVSQLPG